MFSDNLQVIITKHALIYVLHVRYEYIFHNRTDFAAIRNTYDSCLRMELHTHFRFHFLWRYINLWTLQSMIFAFKKTQQVQFFSQWALYVIATAILRETWNCFRKFGNVILMGHQAQWNYEYTKSRIGDKSFYLYVSFVICFAKTQVLAVQRFSFYRVFLFL
jgi:hypothetical protein